MAVVSLLLLLFQRSPGQLEFLLLLGVSLSTMGWLGQVALGWMKSGTALDGTLFFKVFIGQIALLLLWHALAPLIFLVQSVVSIPAATGYFVVIVVMASLWLNRRARRDSAQWLAGQDPHSLMLGVFGAASIYKVASYYSVTAGALGLDTHQHIAFVVDIFHAGYPRLEAGSTGLIDKYPKLLHGLVALWAWPGFGDHIGPFLKIQPSLQSLICTLAMMELLLVWLRRTVESEVLLWAWQAAASVALAYLLFRATAMVYPVPDLSSTARISSAACVLLPLILGLASHLYPRRGLELAAWASLPLSAALCVGFNPSLAFAWLTVSLPSWIVMLFLPWVAGRRSTSGRAAFAGIVAGTIAGTALLISSPYYLHLAAEQLRVVRLALEWVGLQPSLPPESAELGVELAQILSRFREVVAWVAWKDPATVWWKQVLPASGHFIAPWLADTARAVHLLVFGVYCAVALGARVRGTRLPVMALAVQAVLFLAAMATWFVATVILLLVGHGTLEASLLSTYVHRYIDLFGLLVLPIHVMLTLALVTQMAAFALRGRLARPVQITTGVGVAAIAGAIGFLTWHPVPGGPLPESLGWGVPVTETQVDEFQRLESRLSTDARVLAPALPALLNGREDWILPATEASSLLPFGRRSYIFNVRLGDGYLLTAADLRSSFCEGDPVRARSFVTDHSIDYILVVRSEDEAEGELLDRTYCGISYRELGVVPEGAITGDFGIGFYRIEPHHGRDGISR